MYFVRLEVEEKIRIEYEFVRRLILYCFRSILMGGDNLWRIIEIFVLVIKIKVFIDWVR